MTFLRNISFSSNHEQGSKEDREDLIPKERAENNDIRLEQPSIPRSIAWWSCLCLGFFVVGFVVAFLIFGRQIGKDAVLSPVPSSKLINLFHSDRS